MTEAKGREAVWQNFFERNTWIFGYGLNFVFNSPLEDKKLEQVVSGYNFNNSGKRIDALMKTKGVINSFCFGEIKTHKTDLLKRVKDSYRGECWAISDELAGAIAQTQKTVQKSIKDLSTKIEIKDKRGDLTGEEVYIYQPKSFVVIGNLNEFKSEYGINEDKYSSFELFRQNNINPEIITFDELLERAKFIVKNSENEK
jgi:predicted transcriptional regulator